MPPTLRRRDLLRGSTAALLGMAAASRSRAADAPGLRWQRHLDRGADEAFYDAARGPDGTTVLAGHAGANTDAGLPMEERRPLVVALDADRAVRWEHTPDDATAAGAQTVLATSDGGFLVAGLDAPLAKFAADGAVEWTASPGDPPIRHPPRLAEFAPGTYAVAWDVPGPSGNVLRLAAVEAGERRWSREWGLHHELGALVPHGDRPAVTVVGHRVVDGAADGSWLAIVTADDAVEGSTTYDGPWQHAVRGPDGGLVAGGVRVTGGTRRAAIARLDPSRERAWRRRYDVALPDYDVRDLARAPDGGYALLGSGTVSDPAGTRGATHLLAVDGRGERAWDATYASRERALLPRAFLAPSAGRHLLVGASEPSPGAGFDGWAAALDASASRTLTTTSPTPTEPDARSRTPTGTGTPTRSSPDATTSASTPADVAVPGFGPLAGAAGIAGAALLGWLRARAN